MHAISSFFHIKVVLSFKLKKKLLICKTIELNKMKIQTFSTAGSLKSFLKQHEEDGKSIGFVPTMGALHNGHISLINASKENCDITVCSIFVNPTQFDNPTDLKKYPKTIEQDIAMLEKAKCDAVFIPDVEEVYPNGKEIVSKYDFGLVAEICEGAHRKGHFDGVAQVVGRLLDIVNPHKIFMGQKDYQQANIIKLLTAFKKCRTQVEVCKIIRESDGLAMSSRNRRLSEEERNIAPVLFETQNFIIKNIWHYDLNDLLNISKNMLDKKKKCKLVYIEIREAESLKLAKEIKNGDKLVILTACYVGEIRLIDNMVFDVPKI